MRCVSSAIVVVCFLLGADAAQEDAAKKDLDSLQGVWQVVSLEGTSLPAEKIKTLKMTFKGNKMSHPGGEGKTEEASIKLGPSKKPKAIDMTLLNGPNKGKTALGIYSIEGETLKICGAPFASDRPTEFKASKGVSLIVLKRDKR